MGEYIVVLSDEQEDFLDVYLAVCKLRQEHVRDDYPNLVVNNFINSMMKRKGEFVGRYKEVTGKKFVPKREDGGKYRVIDVIKSAREKIVEYKEKVKNDGNMDKGVVVK